MTRSAAQESRGKIPKHATFRLKKSKINMIYFICLNLLGLTEITFLDSIRVKKG